jgi:hypothetical protein
MITTKSYQPLELIKKTVTSLMLRVHAPDFNMEQYQYVLFGKQKKTGVKVTTNDKQLLGTGTKRAPYEDCLISGLEPNFDYVFSVQQYDQIGLPVDVMTPGQEFATSFPLPLQLCWCYLSLIAFQSDCISIAKQAANKMIASVLHTEEERPLWEQNPLYQMSIDVPQLLESIPKILLYELMRVMTMFGDVELEKEKPLGEDVDPRLDCDLINRQISRLKICNKYLMVLEVCRAINDARMIREMIIKIYGCLAPVINQPFKSRFIYNAMLEIMGCLEGVMDGADANIYKTGASVIYVCAVMCVQFGDITKLKQCAETFCQLYKVVKAKGK